MNNIYNKITDDELYIFIVLYYFLLSYRECLLLSLDAQGCVINFVKSTMVYPYKYDLDLFFIVLYISDSKYLTLNFAIANPKNLLSYF